MTDILIVSSHFIKKNNKIKLNKFKANFTCLQNTSLCKMAALASGANFTAINAGKFSNLLKDHKGKLFIKDAIKSTAAEASLSVLPPGEGVPIIHTHKANEEIYIVLCGEGQYQVDGQQFAITEGSIVRVAPAGKRCIINTSKKDPLTFICFQAKAGSIGAVGMGDCDVLEEKPVWK